jgi:hypothetical protein
MKKFLSLSLALLFSFNSCILSAQAGDNDHQTYALDKLANAQAQLDRLTMQEKAIRQLKSAVRKDLRAARIRAKAERIQLEANTQKQDAAVMVEQSGVAVDLPNLMNTRKVGGGLIEYSADEEVERMFNDNRPKTKSVYFPGGSKGKKVEAEYQGLNSDSDIPDYIK